jgi:hypothetical protein
MPTNTNPDLTPTPETDALRDRLIMTFLSGGNLDQASISNAVFDSARKLERERDALRLELVNRNSWAREVQQVAKAIERERDQWKKAALKQRSSTTIETRTHRLECTCILCEAIFIMEALNQQNERR